MYTPAKFSDLVGKVIVQVDGLVEQSEKVTFTCDDGKKYTMFHEQECCEEVDLMDISGDIAWILNEKIVLAEERRLESRRCESMTWTFYELVTLKGSITLRWFGTSNGYYSEEVSFMLEQETPSGN